MRATGTMMASTDGRYTWQGGRCVAIADNVGLRPHRDHWGRVCYTVGPFHLWLIEHDEMYRVAYCLRDAWWVPAAIDVMRLPGRLYRGIVRGLWRVGLIERPAYWESFSWREHFRPVRALRRRRVWR